MSEEPFGAWQREVEAAWAERDRYKTECDELLEAFFESYDTRQHIFQAILAGDPDAKQIASARQAGPSQSG